MAYLSEESNPSFSPPVMSGPVRVCLILCQLVLQLLLVIRLPHRTSTASAGSSSPQDASSGSERSPPDLNHKEFKRYNILYIYNMYIDPMCSIYGIFTYIRGIFGVNIGKYPWSVWGERCIYTIYQIECHKYCHQVAVLRKAYIVFF